MVKRLLPCALLLCMLVGTGCDTNSMDDEVRVLSGVWKGPITHTNPDLNGTLTLTLTQAGTVLTGTATWRSATSTSSGDLLGTAAESGPITYTIDYGRGNPSFYEAVLRADGTLDGTWQSSRSSAISGTFALQRQ